MSVRDLSFEDVEVGSTASITRAWSAEDVDAFARLSGDINPLHVDDTYARTTPFGARVVHGAFLASSVSALVGTELPGKRCLLLSLDLVFKKPTYIGQTVSVVGTVIRKSTATKMVTVQITITCGDEVRATGEVRAIVRDQ